MVANLEELDVTRSPSNRSTSSPQSLSQARIQVGNDLASVPESVYAITGDDTTVVIVPVHSDDPRFDPSIDFLVRPYSRTEGYLSGTNYPSGDLPIWSLRAGNPQRTDWLPASMRFGLREDLHSDLSNVALSSAQEVLRVASGAIAELVAANQSMLADKLLEAISVIRRLSIGTELGAILDQLSGTERSERESLQEPSPWASRLLQVKRLAALSDAEIAMLFGVTRSNVQAWFHRGQGMRPDRQRHLLEVLEILKDANQRTGGEAQALRQALLSPVGPDRLTPLDYLSARKYLVARGYLQTITQPEDSRRVDRQRTALRSTHPLSKEVRLAALEELSPPPRFDRDDAQG